MLAQNAIALKKAEQLRESARKRLAATWGSRDALSQVTEILTLNLRSAGRYVAESAFEQPGFAAFCCWKWAHRKAEIAVADAK
ncbi:MAG: hypothetical protein R3C26_07725 [Calditrichia bacterium]